MVDLAVLLSPTTLFACIVHLVPLSLRLRLYDHSLQHRRLHARAYLPHGWSLHCSLQPSSSPPLHTSKEYGLEIPEDFQSASDAFLPIHTLLESRTAVPCAGRWIPPKCELQGRADKLFSSYSVRKRYQIEMHKEVRRGDEKMMRAQGTYYYESACTVLASLHVQLRRAVYDLGALMIIKI